MKERIKYPYLHGVIASLALASLYFIIVSIAQGFPHALEEFLRLWYLMVPLIAGFGVQVSLFFYVRRGLRAVKAGTAGIAASGGVSAASMVACCAHHVVDVLPLVGLSAASLFVTKYQTPFIILGVFSNLVGITMMLNIMQKHGLSGRLPKYDMENIRNITIVVAVIVVAAAFGTANSGIGVNATGTLQTKVNNENGVSVEVKPVDFGFGKPVKMSITIDTHQGALDFDMTKISVLQDDKGNLYGPVNWEGSPAGGHHRSGILTFPELTEKTGYITLTIKGVYGIPARVFTWNLE